MPAILPLTRASAPDLCARCNGAHSKDRAGDKTTRGSGAMDLDMKKLEPLLGTMVNELGAAGKRRAGADRRQARALSRAGAGSPLTSAELAKKTGTHERYVREWLAAQAASGFVTYDATAGTVHAVAGAGGRIRRRGEHRQHDGRLLLARRRLRRRAEADRGLQDRQGRRLGRPLQLPVLRRRAVLPSRLQGRISWPSGCPPSTASLPSSSAAPGLPTSAAVTAPRP